MPNFEVAPGFVIVPVGSRMAVVIDYDAVAIEAGRLPGSAGHRSGCWCADTRGGWGVGPTPEAAVRQCARPVTYRTKRAIISALKAGEIA